MKQSKKHNLIVENDARRWDRGVPGLKPFCTKVGDDLDGANRLPYLCICSRRERTDGTHRHADLIYCILVAVIEGLW